MSGRGGGNSLSGADSGLSFERKEESLCEEWRWNETSEGEAADVKQRAAIRLAQTQKNGAEALGLTETTWQSLCEKQ